MVSISKNNKSKLLILGLCIFMCIILSSCNKKEILKDDKTNDMDNKKNKENISNESTQKENYVPAKEKIEEIVSDFDLLGLDNYKIDKEDGNYLIHNGYNKLLIDQNYNLIGVEQEISMDKKLPSKYKSLDEFIKMLSDKKYVDDTYKYNRKYPILEEGYNVYITKKYKNGIFNPFDAINFSYNNVNNHVVSYIKRQDYTAKDSPQLTLDEAFSIAKELVEKDYKSMDVSKVLNKDYLVVSDEQYPILKEKGKKFAEIYLIEFKGGAVLIDANTKEVLFIDPEKTS